MTLLLLLATIACHHRQSVLMAQPIPPKLRENPRFRALVYTPPAYRVQALRLMVADANRTAKELMLPEKLPIAVTNLVGFYVSPPRLSRILRTIGTVSTSNYLYAPFAGKGFALVRRDLESEEAGLRARYLWPTNRMDTNAAYHVAVQILSKVKVNIGALSRDCQSHILTSMPDGPQGRRFVPIYWVYWTEKERRMPGSAAFVELFEPGKMILQLHVGESRLILRKPLVTANTDYLSPQISVVAQTNALARRHDPPVKE